MVETLKIFLAIMFFGIDDTEMTRFIFSNYLIFVFCVVGEVPLHSGPNQQYRK